MNEIIDQLKHEFRLLDSEDKSKSFYYERPGRYPNIDLFLVELDDLRSEMSTIIFVGVRMEYAHKNRITNEWG